MLQKSSWTTPAVRAHPPNEYATGVVLLGSNVTRAAIISFKSYHHNPGPNVSWLQLNSYFLIYIYQLGGMLTQVDHPPYCCV